MKNIIYTNDVCYEEVQESYELDFPNSEGYDDDSRMRIFYDFLADDFEETKRILDRELGNDIVAFKKLGLWNGVRYTARIIGTNLDECLSENIGDLYEYYVEDGEFKCKDVHHDGTNFYTFRRIKDEFCVDDLAEYLLSHTLVEAMNDLTEPIGDLVKEIYEF